MKGVIIHGGLLAVMLAYGYTTWTRDKSAKPTAGQVVMWTRPVADVKTIEMATTDRTLHLERRGSGADEYWWGSETRTTKRSRPVPPSDDPAAPPPAPTEETVTDTREFPVGDVGTKLVSDLAAMRAVKVIGTLKDAAKKDYGLDDTSKTISVVFGDGSKTLVLGGSVFSGSDRYVMDVDTNKVFVVSRSVISPLEGGESSLKPLDLRSFDPKSAQQIEIAAAGKTKAVSRIKVTKPADPAAAADPHAPPTAKKDEVIETWGTGTTADQTAANFIDKLEKLRPTRFEPNVDPASLSPLVALTYRDAHGKVLGTIKLLKRPRAKDEPQTVPADPEAGQPFEYFMITERTRVPARVPALAADRVEQDVSTVFPDAAAAGAGSGSAAGSGSGSAAGSGSGSAAGSGSSGAATG
ncbi:MAG TPA: DUF4340 domain-containing protein, partial [Kofleriaceae bacterium]|nr:DUF4340 domain-containing protein [Kofleriaceae bacterium]